MIFKRNTEKGIYDQLLKMIRAETEIETETERGSENF